VTKQQISNKKIEGKRQGMH